MTRLIEKPVAERRGRRRGDPLDRLPRPRTGGRHRPKRSARRERRLEFNIDVALGLIPRLRWKELTAIALLVLAIDQGSKALVEAHVEDIAHGVDFVVVTDFMAVIHLRTPAPTLAALVGLTDWSRWAWGGCRAR